MSRLPRRLTQSNPCHLPSVEVQWDLEPFHHLQVFSWHLPSLTKALPSEPSMTSESMLVSFTKYVLYTFNLITPRISSGLGNVVFCIISSTFSRTMKTLMHLLYLSMKEPRMSIHIHVIHLYSRIFLHLRCTFQLPSAPVSRRLP